MNGPKIALFLLAGYLVAGFLFSLAFVTIGITRIDPAARGTSVAFRLLILPGSTVLWPVLTAKWVRHRRHST